MGIQSRFFFTHLHLFFKDKLKWFFLFTNEWTNFGQWLLHLTLTAKIVSEEFETFPNLNHFRVVYMSFTLKCHLKSYTPLWLHLTGRGDCLYPWTVHQVTSWSPLHRWTRTNVCSKRYLIAFLIINYKNFAEYFVQTNRSTLEQRWSL